MSERLLVATQSEIVVFDTARSRIGPAVGLGDYRPMSLAADPLVAGRAWCCTRTGGVFRSDDAGMSWYSSGLEGQNLMTIAASPARPDRVWVGAEPSAVWHSDDAGATWERCTGLDELPSSSEWAFPPRPDTHHVRWIACHPADADRLWVAIEAGALIRTNDGGRSWTDRVPGGPFDTHELAVHSTASEVLRAAAGDGYFESHDGGESWVSPMTGLEVSYLRSVAIDPGNAEIVVVTASTRAHSAYVAGRSDGRLYRREADGPWERVRIGWPDPPTTIAPLLAAGREPGEFWAADERGIHHSVDGAVSWELIGAFETKPNHLRGLAIVDPV